MVRRKKVCSHCLAPIMSSEVQRHPDLTEAQIPIMESVSEKDPKDPKRIITVNVPGTYTQKPAIICLGCYDDFQAPLADTSPMWLTK